MDKRYGILIVSVTILVLCFVGTASARTWYVDDDGETDFTRIQDAINNASVGDTILVYSGVYCEYVDVDKSVTLKGIGHPIVGTCGQEDAIRLTADGITLEGFTAGSFLVGIEVRSNNNIITGNTFVNAGLAVYESYQNTVENNTVNGKPLVYLEDVSDYKVEDAGQVILVNCNNITVENLDLSKTIVGIMLWKTGDSKVLNNTVGNNKYGIHLTSSSNNTITGNNVSNNNESGIYLFDSSNNAITGNNVCNNNDDGISIFMSSNNAITGNNVSNNNDDGIYLSLSSSNAITGNNVSNNNESGIYLGRSSNNNIYLNNFINNTDDVFSSKATNIWNSTLKITYTYDETTYGSYLGNYWDDYEGIDEDGDGIGDTPYNIDSDCDNYPLLVHFENYILPISAHT